MDINSFSIEHIMPISTQKTCVTRIGNLLPLGIELNSNIGNKNFKQKMMSYKKSKYESVIKFISEYENEENWTEGCINRRTSKIAEILYNKKTE